MARRFWWGIPFFVDGNMGIGLTEQSEISSELTTIDKGTVLESFEPNENGQDLIFLSKAHEMFVLGGNSSGKSWCGIINCAYHIIPEKDIFGKVTGKTIHPYMDLRVPSTGIEGWISCWSEDNLIDTLHPIIDKILLPYSIDQDIKDRAYQRMYFEGGSWINFKTQTQKLESYRGPKKRFVYLDEPHKEQIYKESRARLFKSGGYMWTCMTPIIDEHSPLSSRDVTWMRDEILEPYKRNPDKYPLRDVIYLDVEDNYQHLPGGKEFVEALLDSMSPHERAIRKSGTLLTFTGRHWFNGDIITTIRDYLHAHPEESAPQYGSLSYDSTEKGEWEVQFIPDEDDFFLDKPSGDYKFRMWEAPVTNDDLQLSPGYTISVDVAEGKEGGDFTSAYVFRNDNRRIVAGLHGHIPEEKLAGELYLMGHFYKDRVGQAARMAIEVANFGRVTQKLMMVGNPNLNVPKYPGHRFYYRPTPKDIAIGRDYAHAPGWDTNKQTRKDVLMAMKVAFMMAYNSIAEGKKCTIPDIACLNEATEFIMRKTERFEGYPDDRLFSLGIGHCVLDRRETMHSEEPEKTPELSDDQHWFLNKDKETGIHTVQFNVQGILNTISKGTSSDNIRF